MYRAVLLVTLVHLASCRIINNDVESDKDVETFREDDVEERTVSECRVASKSFVVNVTEKVSWFSAYMSCRDNKMELAVIGNVEEYQMLVNTINTQEVKDNGVWTSGYYDTEEGLYRWMTRLTPMNYTVWQPGRPGTSDNRHKCVELRKYDQYKMNDVSCIADNYVACQKQEFSWGSCESP